MAVFVLECMNVWGYGERLSLGKRLIEDEEYWFHPADYDVHGYACRFDFWCVLLLQARTGTLCHCRFIRGQRLQYFVKLFIPTMIILAGAVARRFRQ